MVTDGGYQALFLVSDQGVIVVDCPPSIGIHLKYAIGNVTSAPIKKFIYSHSHADHIEGAYLFKDYDVEFISHQETAAILAEVPDPRRPIPQTTFSESRTINLGNQTLELSYKGPNHESGNIFIYAPKQKVLMLVDVIFPGWVPFSGLGSAQDIPGFIKAHDQVLGYDFNHFVGGHLSRSGNRQDVQVAKEYVQDLYNACVQVLNSGLDVNAIIGPVAAKNPGNQWAIYKTYLDTLSTICANNVSPKWVSRLAGADTLGFENAYKMIESLRIDYAELGPFGVVVK